MCPLWCLLSSARSCILLRRLLEFLLFIGISLIRPLLGSLLRLREQRELNGGFWDAL